MPAPDSVAPRRKPNNLLYASVTCHLAHILNQCNRNTACQCISKLCTQWRPPAHPFEDMTQQSNDEKKRTHPPLKAPTGFFTGAATTSCLSAALVWNPRGAEATDAVKGARRAPTRAAVERMRAAIAAEGGMRARSGFAVCAWSCIECGRDAELGRVRDAASRVP